MHKIWKLLRKAFLSSIAFFILFLAFIYWSDQKIESYSNSCYSNIRDVPEMKVGLVLGTAKYLRNGRVNLYYKYRIEAAIELFNSGRIEYLLISGDNSRKEYDEPTTFKKDLVERGIPEEKIMLDYAGFRTLDSVERAKTIFGQNELIIVSQPFHNKRALFLADAKGLKAVGYNARQVSGRYGIKVQIREFLARSKATLDVYALHTEPKFYGEPIAIP